MAIIIRSKRSELRIHYNYPHGKKILCSYTVHLRMFEYYLFGISVLSELWLIFFMSFAGPVYCFACYKESTAYCTVLG